MTVGAPLTAGIDVGNSTTEVVLGRHRTHGSGVEVVAAGQVPTRGVKGSAASLDGAAALVRRLERRVGTEVSEAAAAPLRPVTTSTAGVPEDLPSTGCLVVVAPGATPGGSGAGIGTPVLLTTTRATLPDGPLVVLVPAGTGHRAAVAGLLPLVSAGRCVAVVLGDDEAVLVSHRLGGSTVPVVDEVSAADIERLTRARIVAVEVGDSARPLHLLGDPVRLGAELRTTPDEASHVVAATDLLRDSRTGIVAAGQDDDVSRAVEPVLAGWIRLRGGAQVPFLRGHPMVRDGAVGAACAYGLPPDLTAYHVDDLWILDLAAVSDAVLARRPGVSARPVSLAALRVDRAVVDPADGLSMRLGVPVRTLSSEAAASYAGGRSTPGAGPGALVVDLGGGTVDATGPGGTVVAAGAGEQLTVSVAALAGISAAAAEWVKRGPAHRVEAPQVLLAEDGSRTFLDRPVGGELVGSLVVSGPAGLLPFHRSMAPGEWRALRLRLKVDLVGGNVARVLRTLTSDGPPADHRRPVIVVGGPAGDDEMLRVVTAALPSGTPVGRGDVAGSLGHRFAVAYGLLLAD